MNEELRYKNIEEVKTEGNFVKAINFKPKLAPIIALIFGVILLIVNNMIARLLGAFFIILSFVVLKEVKDYKVMDIFDKGILIYSDDKNSIACFIPFENIKEWSINRDNGNDAVKIRLIDDSLIMKNTFEADKAYRTLYSLLKEKDKNYIRAQKNKLLSIPETFENIVKRNKDK